MSVVYTRDELLCFLVECFPEADFDRLRKAAIVNDSKEEAIEFLLAEQLSPLPDDPNQSVLAQLVDIFPEVAVEDLTEVIAGSSGAPVLDDLVDEVMVRHAFCGWTDDEADECDGLALGAYQHAPDWAPVAKKKVVRTRLDVRDFSFRTPTSSPGAAPSAGRPFHYAKWAHLGAIASYDLGTDELRDEISRLHEQRRGLYERATEAFSRGGLTGSQTASFYSERAKEVQRQLESLKLHASYRVYLRNNPDPCSLTLDLHWLTVDEAVPLTKAFLTHHMAAASGLPGPLRIITGAGKHSNPGIGPRLRPAVWRTLGQSRFRFEYDGHAVFTVLGVQAGKDHGC